MISLVLVAAAAGFTTPARQQLRSQQATSMLQPGSAWSEWSLQQVGALDFALLTLGVGGVYLASSASPDDEPTKDIGTSRRDPNELPGLFDRSNKRSSPPRMGLDDGRFNRRNMSIDERRAYDALMKKREENAKVRNVAVAVILVVVGLYVGFHSSASAPSGF